MFKHLRAREARIKTEKQHKLTCSYNKPLLQAINKQTVYKQVTTNTYTISSTQRNDEQLNTNMYDTIVHDTYNNILIHANNRHYQTNR